MKKIIILLMLVLCSNISSLCQNTSTIIFTPRGTSVQAFTSDEHTYYSPEQWTEMSDYYSNVFQAQLLEYNTPTYNGNGYAWHYSEGGGRVVIDSSEVKKYWLDGSYIEVPESLATKVFYDGSNHSAVRESSGMYVSKWDAGPLLRHYPDNVPYSNYQKRYYMRTPSIVGDDVLCGSGVYYLPGLPNTYDVTWGFSDSNLNDLITQDYPSANQCFIENDGSSFSSTLIATISKNGQPVTTVSKEIEDNLPFVGYFSQQPLLGSSAPIIADTQFWLGNNINVNRGSTVTIKSEKFKQMTVSSDDVFIQRLAYNKIKFILSGQFPTGIIRLHASGCGNFSIGVNVVEEDEAGQLIFNRIGNTLWISFSIDTNELGYMYLCSLTITKLSTGVQVYSDEIGGNLFEVDTTNWPSGIYVATVSILGTTDTYSGSFIIN